MSLILRINDRFRNRKVELFDRFEFTLKFNSLTSNFGFLFYYDKDRIEHKELSCVSHFHGVELDHIPTGATTPERVLSGMLINQEFIQSSTKSLSSFGGYALTGQLADCSIPPEVYPLQSDGLSLKQIAEKLIRPFGIELVVDPEVSSLVNGTFKNTTASPTQTVQDYLATLAKQKDIILSHDEQGRLLMTKAKVNAEPILNFDLTNGTPDGYEFSITFNGQGMHRYITVMRQASINGGNAGQERLRNPYVINTVYRPKVIEQTSGNDNDTISATRRERANELRGIGLTIRVHDWSFKQRIIKPNNTIKIKAPELYIFREETFFIESVKYTGNKDEQVCELNCVLPEVYNGKDPVNIYRGINLHALDV